MGVLVDVVITNELYDRRPSCFSSNFLIYSPHFEPLAGQLSTIFFHVSPFGNEEQCQMMRDATNRHYRPAYICGSSGRILGDRRNSLNSYYGRWGIQCLTDDTRNVRAYFLIPWHWWRIVLSSDICMTYLSHSITAKLSEIWLSNGLKEHYWLIRRRRDEIAWRKTVRWSWSARVHIQNRHENGNVTYPDQREGHWRVPPDRYEMTKLFAIILCFFHSVSMCSYATSLSYPCCN